MKRMLFALQNVFAKRKELHRIRTVRSLSCQTVLDITPKMLEEKGIAVLVLDFDGVLSPHDARFPLPSVLDWLADLQQHWHGRIFIFTNKPSAEREAFFADFDHIGFVKNVPRKPYPDGILQVQQQTNVSVQQILMVDDRLLTGILSAILAGAQTLWISKPFQDFKANPIPEAWFHCLRLLDRILV